jgi:hypothetical protein
MIPTGVTALLLPPACYSSATTGGLRSYRSPEHRARLGDLSRCGPGIGSSSHRADPLGTHSVTLTAHPIG